MTRGSSRASRRRRAWAGRPSKNYGEALIVTFGEVGLYQHAGLFVLPSHYEGFGFTVLEAMGCGTPAVIANRASLPEIAGDAALSVDPDDVEAIADALYRGLTDSTLRQSLVSKGLARAREFTWQKTACATLDLYRRVLAS